MCKIKILFLTTTLLCFLDLKAQSPDTTGIINKNGTIENMKEYIGFKLAVTNDFETFSVRANNNYYTKFAPNTATVSKLFLNYRIVSLSVAFAPDFLPGNGDNQQKGNTKTFGFGLGFNFSQFFTNLNYSHVKGYYLSNTKDFIPSWKPGDPYTQIPNLESTTIEGATGYNFNPDFSQKSLTTQTERQLKSEGAFIPLASYKYFIIQNTGANAQKSYNFQFLLGAGYHYNFVISRQFYLYAGGTPSYGYIFTKLKTPDSAANSVTITHQQSPIVQLSGSAGLGYNAERFFGGAYGTYTWSDYRQQNTTAVNENNRIFFQVFVGYRLKAPRFLRHTYDEVSDQVKEITPK